MQVSDPLHAPAALPPGKELPMLTFSKTFPLLPSQFFRLVRLLRHSDPVQFTLCVCPGLHMSSHVLFSTCDYALEVTSLTELFKPLNS
jgi:hypothetical protein